MKNFVGRAVWRIFGVVCVAFVCAGCTSAAISPNAATEDPTDGATDAATQAAIDASQAVMTEFLAAFNARDEPRWAKTLHFPHVRIASGSVSVVPSEAAFLATTDMDAFARQQNWQYSEWDAIEVVQADPTKVHLKVVFSRFNPQGERYATFNSLYILQRIDGRWAIRGRSSFAP